MHRLKNNRKSIDFHLFIRRINQHVGQPIESTFCMSAKGVEEKVNKTFHGQVERRSNGRIVFEIMQFFNTFDEKVKRVQSATISFFCHFQKTPQTTLLTEKHRLFAWKTYGETISLTNCSIFSKRINFQLSYVVIFSDKIKKKIKKKYYPNCKT